MNQLNGYDVEDLRLGMSASFSKTITEADLVLFAGVSGDNNAMHVNEEFAAATPFGGRIARRSIVAQTFKVSDAIESIPDGATLMIGGFMAVGSPRRLIDELVRQGKKGLTVIANDTARPGFGIGKLISARLVRRVVTSHIGTNPETQRQMPDGQLDVELAPQGTLAERIRAGGYGLGDVLTPTGIGTLVEQGKRSLEIDGRLFLLEMPLRADFALINARRADHIGNLTYAMTARNFNPLMAMAADMVIAESQEIVPVGVIAPDDVMTPAVLVDRLVAKERVHG